MKSVDELAKMWMNTPWVGGQSDPGYGADCLRFVDMMYLSGIGAPDGPPPRRMPQDSAWHDATTAREALEAMIKRWSLRQLEDGEPTKPWDGVTALNSHSPTHAGVVADDGIRLWNAGATGVSCTSVEALRASMKGRVRVFRSSRV